jgi:hypothetical protein
VGNREVTGLERGGKGWAQRRERRRGRERESREKQDARWVIYALLLEVITFVSLSINGHNLYSPRTSIKSTQKKQEGK